MHIVMPLSSCPLQVQMKKINKALVEQKIAEKLDKEKPKPKPKKK